MKTLKFTLLALAGLCLSPQFGHAQFMKKLKEEAKQLKKDIVGGDNDISDVRMPAAGELHTDEWEAEAGKQITALCKRDGTTFKRAIILSDEWASHRNRNTGLLTGRSIMGVFADQKSSGKCMIHTFTLYESFDGADFSKARLDAVSQDLRYGPYIECENIFEPPLEESGDEK